MHNQLIKQQFNKQAQNFSNWEITQNQQYIKAYFDFCEIQLDDTLLDVACGSGEFSIYCADKIKKVIGIDISDREIEIGRKYVKSRSLKNVEFYDGDVEKLPFSDSSFSVIICKSAFHHFIHGKKNFSEMARCASKGGKISIQDICAYENKKVNDFFEKFEKEVDISHNRVLSKNEFIDFYMDAGLKMIKKFELFVDLNLNEYLSHAAQTEENIKNINELINVGLHNPDISKFLFLKDNELYFKREVFLVLGKK